MNVAVLIPAAGFSTRYAEALRAELGAEVARSKLDEDLGGRPVLHRTVELFTQTEPVASVVSLVVVAGPHDPEAFAEFKHRHGDKLGMLGVKLVRGGQTHRYETVRAALEAVPEETGAGKVTHIAVHDAARPCTPLELIEKLFELAEQHAAVIPALDVSDTLKRVGGEVKAARHDPLDAILGEAGKGGRVVRKVEQTVDRSGLVAVQTPQVFRADVLRRAYGQKDLTSTDDAQLVERLGEVVVVAEGDARNIKITRPMDLQMARGILGVKGGEGRSAHKRF